ncbi:MAG: peptidylprolyl isomerase [Candidatus Jettenia sp. CY-1]|nr:peptidylprolyl isomerase [Candidatus Jettenia sp.]WKZ18568.1 MAG: peptidylprolyl isomerase [Candidatus Jettenia sp. CY-1]
MARAKYGDTVKIHYTGKLEDGTIFDTSINRKPLRFTIGKGSIISGLEEAVIGMEPGELKTIRVPSNKAHGSYDEELIVVIDREEFPSNLEPEVGHQLDIYQEDGGTVVVTVTNITEQEVTLDINHPLAGKDLIFHFQLIEIIPPSH